MNILSRYRSPRYSKGFHVVDTSKISEGVEGIYLFFLSEGFNAHPIPHQSSQRIPPILEAETHLKVFFGDIYQPFFLQNPHPCLFLRGLALGKNRGLKSRPLRCWRTHVAGRPCHLRRTLGQRCDGFWVRLIRWSIADLLRWVTHSWHLVISNRTPNCWNWIYQWFIPIIRVVDSN